MKNKFFKLLDEIKQEESKSSTFNSNDRVMIIDGLNLFLRNFAIINYINQYGNHIGGLGGFLRSLGSLIYLIKPTSVYVVFDGKGSSTSRKNLIPEYKSSRNNTRLTNFDIFKNINDENEAKVNQITRLIHYLQCLPLKTISLDGAEADDIIAYISKFLSNKLNSKIFIISADQDYTQLVNKNITLYKPIEKEFFTPIKVKEKYGVIPENFLLYKMLKGDDSDDIKGIPGLGPKKLPKRFPELINEEKTFDDIEKFCIQNLKKHRDYAYFLHNIEEFKKKYKIMDLKNPLLGEEEKTFLEELINQKVQTLRIQEFLQLYKEDGLNNNLLKNPSFWLKENFTILNNIK